jgi:hypothetical protein
MVIGGILRGLQPATATKAAQHRPNPMIDLLEIAI